MAEFLIELAMWLRGSDREGTIILWRVAAVVLAAGAAILGIAVLIDSAA